MLRVSDSRMNIQWVPVEDGEYNEVMATLPNGTVVVVFSDRDETEWDCFIDDGQMIKLNAKTEEEARAQALRRAQTT